MSNKRIVIAIDGPGGAGKSTIARRVAEKLGFVYINTGAMYRALALWALRTGTSTADMHRMQQLAQEARLEFGPGNGRISLNGEDVSDHIQGAEVADAASKISAIPAVRRALLNVQREIADTASVVMEGRDIGTVVFPSAQVKIFLDADVTERAQRRTREIAQRGEAAAVEEVAAGLAERDQRDRTRTEAPLVQAPDAQLVDTTGLTLEQVEDEVLRIVRERTSNGKDVSRKED